MERFIVGSDAQFNWLNSQIQEGLKIFNDITLPASCIPNICHVGFEYTQAIGYKVYIDKNIMFSGNHSGFRNLLSCGEASFNTFEDMKRFIRGLNGIYITPQPREPALSNNLYIQPLRTNRNSLNYTATSSRGNSYNFSFKYEKIGDIWRAYIVNAPSYGLRSTSWSSIHRLNDGRDYVCWQPEPKTLDDITRVSKMWADATAEYIATGRSFG